MIYGRLQVAALPPFPQHNNVCRLSGRLSVLDDSIKQRSFDTVQLCFRGVITSSVGYKTGLEDIITLTDIKTPSDFRPCSSTSQNDSQKGRHADFYFELPTHASTKDGTLRSLPLSATISVNTSPAPNTAMNDRPVIRGECEVSYWVEAQFRLAGKQVGILSRHVQIPSLYPCLRASISRGHPLTMHAKPDFLTRCKFQKNPDLSITLHEPEMIMEWRTTTGKRHVSLPLAIAMDMQQQTSDCNSIDPRQSFQCSVEAKWEVNSRFSNVPVHSNTERLKCSDVVYKTTLASSQKANVLFRPLPHYDGSRDSRNQNANNRTSSISYTATSQVDLSVPNAVSQPSLYWGLLSRTYTLDLSLHFHGVQGAPNYNLHRKIPLSVFTYGSKADDAQKDQVVVDVAEADSGSGSDSESDADNNVDDLLASRAADRVQEPVRAQARRQRTVNRTPPPPYFR
ncbi:uncharacterized protein Z518_10177 [Rhinocladiella mackenziei CBS 650.93]|uniref:Rhinocladiella mackenziei CBS 650.93 unplaced genomic scaffold supercont1.8, whole genome shotgun sequence n=1 Tax=Rhinocladiella mackenziei CBS 650.93 TaxID=1442369 RepID=A0A0D2ID00_9EURO|nr:uncharacterized protein Z518_10177 [Rhinocladiella mackenziei CBS 650.93]KIX01111.1 hypothetical protein Z518_10177 [Rhinocladiella mackenziei CBS 650.93]